MPDPMTLLKQDHRTVKQLLQQLKDTEAGNERRRIIDEIGRELEVHMEIEEQLLYPLLAESDPEHAQGAQIEHGLAREGLNTLRELQDSPGFGAAVEMLIAGLQHHIREEESELLPTLKADMERAMWMDLGTQIEEMKQAKQRPTRQATRTGRR